MAASSLMQSIGTMLAELPNQSENWSIYRVPKLLRGLNPDAHTPMAVPIGPIHHRVHGQDSSQVDDPELLNNRLDKLQYLRSFLLQSEYNDVKFYLDLVEARKSEIREHYAYLEKIFRENDEVFMEMVLLDCIFIIQLFREHSQRWGREKSIFMAPLKLKEIASDLLLAENQLPLFILEELYYKSFGISAISFTDIACEFLKINSRNLGHPLHLLDMLRISLLPPPQQQRDSEQLPPAYQREYQEPPPAYQTEYQEPPPAYQREWQQPPPAYQTESQQPPPAYQREYQEPPPAYQRESQHPPPESNDVSGIHLPPPQKPVDDTLITRRKSNEGHDLDLHQIMCPTASGLYEAGIKFEVKEDAFSILDISFNAKKGILYIPKLRVDDGTERQFRNLIAFEQSHTKDYTYITDYQFFMDCLINTPADVQLLTKAGITENWLGSENNLCELINSMGIHAYHFTGGYLYSHIATELNIYHKKKWNRYKAILRQGYLSHPWAILGLCTAGLLLLLTIMQSVVGILALPALNKASNN